MVSTKFLFEYINPLNGEGKYILKYDEVNQAINTFPFSGNNFMVFNSNLVKMLLRSASKEDVISSINQGAMAGDIGNIKLAEVKEFQKVGEINNIKPIEVNELQKAIGEINKKIKTENIILLGGDVRKNIPLFTMQERYISEMDSEVDRKLLHTSLDIFEGEREEGVRNTSIQNKIHIADCDFDGLYVYNHVNSLIDSERDLTSKPTNTQAKTKRADVILNNDTFIDDGLIITERADEKDRLVGIERNVKHALPDYLLKASDTKIEVSIPLALPDYINKTITEKKTKKGSLYSVNVIKKENTLGKATKYYIAKKTIVEKPSIWGMILDKKDIDTLISIIIGINLSEKRTVPIPMRLVKILETLIDVPPHEIIVVKEDKKATIENIDDVYIENHQRVGLIEDMNDVYIENQRVGLREYKRDLNLNMSITAFLDNLNLVEFTEGHREAKRLEYDGGRIYEDDFLSTGENIPQSGSKLDVKHLGEKEFVIQNGKMIEDISGEKESLVFDKLEDSISGEKQIEIGEIKNQEHVGNKEANLYGKVLEDISGEKENLIFDNLKGGISGEKDILMYGKMFNSLMGYKEIKDKIGSILKKKMLATKGFSSYLMKKTIVGTKSIDDKISILEKLLITEKSSLETQRLSEPLQALMGDNKFGSILDGGLVSEKSGKDAVLETIDVAEKIIKDRFGYVLDNLIAEKQIKYSKIEKDEVLATKEQRYGKTDKDMFVSDIISELYGIIDEDMFEGETIKEGILKDLIFEAIEENKDGKIYDKEYIAEDFHTFDSALVKTIKSAQEIILNGVIDLGLEAIEQEEKTGDLKEPVFSGVEDESLKTGSMLKGTLMADFGRIAKLIFTYLGAKSMMVNECLMIEPEKIAEKIITESTLTDDFQTLKALKDIAERGMLDKILEADKTAWESILNKIKVLESDKTTWESILDTENLKALNIERPAEMLEDPEGERVNLHDGTLNLFGDDGGNGVEKVPKESKIVEKEPTHPPAIGVESPPELWEDADIHDPDDDLNEDDPSADKQTPARWYDNPKTPVQNILEMMVEVKNRGQGLHLPANETADMINHILQNWTKYNVNKNPEEHKTIADFIQKKMDSTLNDVCQLRERVIDDTVVSYHKDFQEDGSWADKEWVGSDRPPETEGVGRWINVDLTKPSGATAEQLDITFAKNGGRLAGLGQACMDAEQKYGINAYYIASHACWESMWGKSQIARDKNNLFGYGAYDWSPYESAWTFPSKSACIDKVMNNVARDYLDPNGRYYGGSPTLKGMNKRYATDMNWANGIATLMKQFAGGHNPPDGLLNGFTAQPYSAWYRYLEPEDEVALEKQYDPNTDDPNYALHSPNNMNVDDKSSVSLRKFSKLDGSINYRAKVNGTITDPSIITRFVDDFNRADFGIGYAVNQAYWAYNDSSKGWRIQNGKAIVNSSSFLSFYFDSKYECMIKARCRVKKYLEDGDIRLTGTETRVYDNSFLGHDGHDGHFRFNEEETWMRANGWYNWIGWGGNVASTGSLIDGSIANAQWNKTFRIGKAGGKVRIRYLNWCSPSQPGATLSVKNINGTQSKTVTGYGNGYPFEWQYVNQNCTWVTFNLAPGENEIDVSVHNTETSVFIFDEIEVLEYDYIETYSSGSPGYFNSSLRAGYFDGVLNLDGGSPNHDTYDRGYINAQNDSEVFDVVIPWMQPSAPGVETRHNCYFSFFQDNPSYLDYATIDSVTIIEKKTSTGGTSFLNFYIDGQLQQDTFYTGKRWNHYEFPVRAGNHEYKWEFVQKDGEKSDYALIDDIEIINWSAKTESYWDCPPDTGEGLIDKVIDSLKDKIVPEEPRHPDAGNIWLMT